MVRKFTYFQIIQPPVGTGSPTPAPTFAPSPPPTFAPSPTPGPTASPAPPPAGGGPGYTSQYLPYMIFDGTNYRDIPHSPSQNQLVFSVGAWFTGDGATPGDAAMIVSKGGSGTETAGGNANYTLRLSSGSGRTFVGEFEDATGIDYEVRTPFGVADGQWHHAVMTYGGNLLRLFMDGVLISETVTGGADPDTGSVLPLRIGGNPRKTPPNLTFLGFIDEVRVWARVLTDQEIFAQWNSGIYDTLGQVVYVKQ